jgi:hypothetical protein
LLDRDGRGLAGVARLELGEDARLDVVHDRTAYVASVPAEQGAALPGEPARRAASRPGPRARAAGVAGRRDGVEERGRDDLAAQERVALLDRGAQGAGSTATVESPWRAIAASASAFIRRTSASAFRPVSRAIPRSVARRSAGIRSQASRRTTVAPYM